VKPLQAEDVAAFLIVCMGDVGPSDSRITQIFCV